MASAGPQLEFITCVIVLLALFVTIATSADMFLDWHVSLDFNIKPVPSDQPVEIIAFNLLIFFIYLFVYKSYTLLPNLIADMIGRL